MLITYLAATHFYQASTQLLNKDVAAHIAKFASPFDHNGLNKQKADSVFQNAMVISPSAEVYFLDTTGKVIDFHAPENEIKLWKLPLENVKKEIASRGKAYIKGPDPKDPSNEKIFSAAEVNGKHGKLGYIYVILGSSEYRNVTDMLFSSHISSLALEAFCFIIVLSIVVSIFYVARLQKRFNQIVNVLDRFQEGDFEARFQINKGDDMFPITQAFNKMADLLVYNINRLKKSEKERKNFIANISHDLRTPLAIAKGYSETLLIKKDNPEINSQKKEDYLQLISNKIQQVEKMVEQLFELSKLESATFEPQKEPFIFSEILQEAVNASALVASQKNIHIYCEGCQNNTWIFADIRMIERVIQNLLSNAISYSFKNGQVQIYLKRRNNELIFQIENTGDNLPQDLIEWINSGEDNYMLSEKPVKSAIGLAIVKKILHLHNYSFQVKSNAQENAFSFHMAIHYIQS
ncbi:MAG: HAMP domain-containing sensor histidine kinase [Chitinophagaceae bacterium]